MYFREEIENQMYLETMRIVSCTCACHAKHVKAMELLSNLTKVDAGFNGTRLVTFSIALPATNLPSARVSMFQRILSNLRALPGVESVTAISGLPPNRPLNANDTDTDRNLSVFSNSAQDMV